jgi:peptide deformylase
MPAMVDFPAGASPLPILVSGDPRLRTRSTEITEIGDIFMTRASELVATLKDFRDRSGFGRAISAPQVGWMERVVAMNLGAGPFVLANPEIVWRSADTFLVWDDCLSVPNVIVRVRRHISIRVRFRDHHFRERETGDLPRDLAELVQHEIDHLDGVLMTDLAVGDDAIQPLSRWNELVGASRPVATTSLDEFAREL